MEKAKFTSEEGCTSDQSQADKQTELEVHSVFFSHASLPLTQMDWFVFTICVIGYLEKGHMG
jgi:hypothetical protein